MNNSEKIKILEATIDSYEATMDSYGIQLVLNKAQVSTLEHSLMALAEHLLTPEERNNFLKDYFHTLIEQSNELCTPPDFPFSQAKVVPALFELQSYVNRQLEKL